MHRFFVAALVGIFAVSGVQALKAQPLSGAGTLFELDALAQSAPRRALREVRRLLRDGQALSARDVFDLERMQADLLLQLDRADEAAKVLERLAKYAVTRRVLVDEDPAPIWEEAARAYEAQGDATGALRAWKGLLAEQRAGGLPPEAQATTLQRMANAAEAVQSPEAQKFRSEAIALLTNPPRPKPKPTIPGARTRGGDAPQAEVELFYATDRARTGRGAPPAFYGGFRGKGLELGVVTVTIPPNHRPGVMEQPSIWRLEFSDNPARHIVLKRIEPMAADAYFDRLQDSVAKTGAQEAFVYIHGFNITFEQGARRAAQMAFDMDFDGVPILYSWPSRGAVTSYVTDSASVRLSARRLTHFLSDVRALSGAKTVHLVAHSMGARALTDALELMALREDHGPDDAPLFGQMMFAAPDIDTDLFRSMLPALRPLAQRVTLYASERDWALVASQKLHGDAPRAGLGGRHTMVDPLIDSVDMSLLGEDMLAHNYFADGGSALADMMTLFWRNLAPGSRCGLDPRAEGDGTVWDYRVGQCADAHLMSVLAHLRREGIRDAEAARRSIRAVVFDPKLVEKLEPVVSDLLKQ